MDYCEDMHFYEIKWPSQEILWQNMPQAACKDTYLEMICITDCSNIFNLLKGPHISMLKPKRTYSTRKKHYQIPDWDDMHVKILYVLHCWGGRVSDHYLTQQCGFLYTTD